MHSDDIAISVQDITKTYRIFNHPADRIKQMLTFGQVQFNQEFTALTGVSFDVKRGETVGIIGRNGSGKSTLLQLVCGILKPTKGKVAVKGRISALLELGTGFHPEFTGRENVYFQGAIMGFTTKYMDQCFDNIEDFAEIGSFIDQPVRTYSSGMFARLAFSVAVHLTPDILIVDEALSVGDMAFQEKAISHMKRIREKGAAILFVSHSLPAIRNFCDTAIWLEKGKIRSIGERLSICEAYQNDVCDEIKHSRCKASRISQHSSKIKRDISGKSISILNTQLSKTAYEMGEQINVGIDLKFFKPVSGYGVGILFFDSRGTLVSILNTLRDDIFLKDPVSRIDLLISNHHFTPGEYSLTVSVSDEQGMFSYDQTDFCATFSVEPRYSSQGLPWAEGFLRCEHEWKY